MMLRITIGMVLWHSRRRVAPASPPIRAIRTGRARRPRCPRFHSLRPWAGPPLDDAKDKWKGRRQGRRWVCWRLARRDAARDAEGGHGISRPRLTEPTAESSCCRRFDASTPSAPRSPERARARDAQAGAGGRREDPRRQRLHCRRSGMHRRPTRPGSTRLGNQLVWQTRIFEDRRQVVKFASARCRPRSTSGCLRSAAPSSRKWNSGTRLAGSFLLRSGEPNPSPVSCRPNAKSGDPR